VVRVGGQRTTDNGHTASNIQTAREFPTGSALNFSLNQLSKQSFGIVATRISERQNARVPAAVRGVTFN